MATIVVVLLSLTGISFARHLRFGRGRRQEVSASGRAIEKAAERNKTC